jgi:hypothetical protein
LNILNIDKEFNIAMIENKMNKIKRGRGRPAIFPWIRDLIIIEARHSRNVAPKALAISIMKDIEARGEIPPTEETLIKKIGEARKYNELDEPWSIAASVRFGIQPEASKYLFDIWRYSLVIDRPISIRQARWVIYLRSLFSSISTGNLHSDKVNEYLWLIRQSWLYSVREQISEIMKEENFDSLDFDAASFMPNWEHATALKLGKIKTASFSKEQISLLEDKGILLKSPPISVVSVEQAVWHNVRAEPPQHMQMSASGFSDEVLPEEDDLVAAYWLMHLSKGTLWNNLPERPEIRKILKAQRQQSEGGVLFFDSGGFPDDSLYSRQLAIRNKLYEWVKKHSSMTLRDYYTLTNQHPALVLSPKLLTMVGYEVSPEDFKRYEESESEVFKNLHHGWGALLNDAKQRLIYDEGTPGDLLTLEKADAKALKKQRQLEQELLEMVNQKGNQLRTRVFWTTIRDEYIKKHPKFIKRSAYGYLQPGEVESEYKRIISEQQKEAQNERANQKEG